MHPQPVVGNLRVKTVTVRPLFARICQLRWYTLFTAKLLYISVKLFNCVTTLIKICSFLQGQMVDNTDITLNNFN